MNREKVNEFLVELSELTKKHGVEIAGCGCCDTPYLVEAKIRDGVYTINCNLGLLEYEAKTDG